jgi:small subunit ribosomal protein S4
MSRLFDVKNRFRPLYKQFIKLRENVQSRKKVFKFTNKKWETFLFFFKLRLKRYSYRKFKPLDHARYKGYRFPTKWHSYKKRFRFHLSEYKKFKLFYGDLSEKIIKKQINLVLKKNLKNVFPNAIELLFLELFDQRLDSVLYKSQFSFSLRTSRQLITHGKVFVNRKVIKTPSYILKPGDLVSLKKESKGQIKRTLRKAYRWPIPPKYLSINYRTMEIIFNSKIRKTSLFTNFPFSFNLEKIILNYSKH